MEIKENKFKYFENLKKGVLVAFCLENGKAKTGKVILINHETKILKVLTECCDEYDVSFEDVMWIKTGKRWPKGVYNKIKAI